MLVDRSPCGSGVTARLAVMYRRGQITLGQRRVFRSITGSEFTGSVVRQVECGAVEQAVVAEVEGEAFYTGTASFTREDRDEQGQGFLLK